MKINSSLSTTPYTLSNMAKRILIIEDDKIMARTLRAELSNEGLEVELAFDGEAGYQMILEQKPDLILLDLLLPRLFGFELLERLRKHKDRSLAALPVVVITNYPEDEYYRKAEALGVKDFVVKSQTSLAEVVALAKKYL